MARIRSIKPEFFFDEKLAKVSRDARLTFIGLWKESDDYGVCRGNHVFLMHMIFPYDADLSLETFSKWIKELIEIGAVSPFTKDGESYLFINNFREHQKIDHPSTTRNPEPPRELLASASRKLRNGSRDSRDGSRKRTLGREGKGEGVGKGTGEGGERDAVATDPSSETKAAEVVSAVEEARLLWNEFAEKKNLPTVLSITPGSKREKTLHARMADKGFSFKALMEAVAAQPFLAGDNKQGWSCTFDWIILPSNYQKIMEGNYRANKGGGGMSGIQEWIDSRKES